MERVVSVKALSNYHLELVFSDGLSKVVNIHPFIEKGLSSALADRRYFQMVQIESGGGIYWPNGYDFCPNFLRDEVPAVNFVDA